MHCAQAIPKGVQAEESKNLLDGVQITHKKKGKQAITLSADSMFTSTNTLSCVLAKWLAMRNIYAATQTTPSGWFVLQGAFRTHHPVHGSGKRTGAKAATGKRRSTARAFSRCRTMLSAWNKCSVAIL